MIRLLNRTKQEDLTICRHTAVKLKALVATYTPICAYAGFLLLAGESELGGGKGKLKGEDKSMCDGKMFAPQMMSCALAQRAVKTNQLMREHDILL